MAKDINDKFISVSLFVVTEENIGKQVSLYVTEDILK